MISERPTNELRFKNGKLQQLWHIANLHADAIWHTKQEWRVVPNVEKDEEHDD